MNDKRNLICGNVMLLSQSRGEISLSAFAKKKLSKTWFESETEKMFDLKKMFNPKIADLTRPL